MIYSEETINAIKDALVAKEETLSVAESVTGGHLQAAFSAGMYASTYFQGGITAYNLGQKARHLRVDPILGERTNCVAEQVANTMAIEVSKMFMCDYGIGITGYASIVPECERDGLFAYFSLAYKGEVVVHEMLRCSEKIPYEVQVEYTKQVLKMVADYVGAAGR